MFPAHDQPLKTRRHDARSRQRRPRGLGAPDAQSLGIYNSAASKSGFRTHNPVLATELSFASLAWAVDRDASKFSIGWQNVNANGQQKV